MSNPYRWKQSGNSKEEILDFFNKSALNEVRSFLRDLEADTERSFEKSVTDFAKHHNDEFTREQLRRIVKEEAGGGISYAAFYLL